MRTSKPPLANDDSGTAINLSPLIDMVFILLIFFIVTTVFVEDTRVDVNKPQAVAIEELEKNSVLIAITAEGRVVHAGVEIGLAGVRAVVSRLATEGRPLPVIIQADQNAEGTLLVRAIDQAWLGGAAKVGISALNPEAAELR